MRNFTYQALTADEELRTGEIIAKSAAAALEELESQGLTVLLIRQAEGPAAEPSRPQPRALPETTGEHLLRDRVAQLLEKRDTLGPALAAFAEELPKGRARRELVGLSRKIQNGDSVDELTVPPALTNIWLPLIGSDSPLGTSHLQNVLAEAERDYANRSYIARSLAYPMLVFLIAFGTLVFLAAFVIPTFRDIFDDFELDLPKITVLVVGFSSTLLRRPLEFIAMAAAIGLGAYGLILFVRHWVLPGRALGAFMNGNSQQLNEMAAFTRRIAEALNAGLPLVDALQVVGRNARHGWLRWEALRIHDELSQGSDVREVLHHTTLPATVTYALQAGPQGSPHIALLQAVAETYFERVRNRFKWSSGFLPHLALLCVGAIVGVVVIALFIPLVELINGLTG